MKKITTLLLSSLLILSGCETPGQNVYSASEVGKTTQTEFGVVVDKTPIKIKGENTGVGTAAGAIAGGAAGSNVGKGDGEVVGILAGALIGAVVGTMAEQAIQDTNGFAYTITLKNGKTVTVSQYFNKGDAVINEGDRVMVQTTGDYQRVLPAKKLPTSVKRPKGIDVID